MVVMTVLSALGELDGRNPRACSSAILTDWYSLETKNKNNNNNNKCLRKTPESNLWCLHTYGPTHMYIHEHTYTQKKKESVPDLERKLIVPWGLL